MKAYLAIKYHPNHTNRSRIEGITRVLEDLGYKTVCVTRDLEAWGVVSFLPEDLMVRSLAEIATSDILVVDLTEKGVGVGIEVGYAHARNIPVFTVAQKGAHISATLRGISTAVFTYMEYDDLANLFSDYEFT